MKNEIKSSDTAYNNTFAISQSAIKDWKKMPPLKWYRTWITKELKRVSSKATSLGSYLDCLMFTPKDTNKRFVVATVQLPSDKVQLVIEDLIREVETLNNSAIELAKANPGSPAPAPKVPTLTDADMVKMLCTRHDHFAKTLDRAWADVVKKGQAYFDFLLTTKGKQVISERDHKMALELQEILTTNKVSKGFFVPKKGCEVVFQQRIFSKFELSGYETVDHVPVKGAVDIVHFNHTKKEVREVDLKCTNDCFNFHESVRMFDYPGQHSFYDYLIREWLKTYKDGKYKDYSVMNPLNVVIDDDLKIPYIYSYKFEDLQIKRHGIENTPITGWEDTIKEIAWHIDNDKWDYPKSHYMNGFLTIQVFNRR